jgi:hypothetical protein
VGKQASGDYFIGMRFKNWKDKKDLGFMLELLIVLTTKLEGNTKI